MILIINRDFCVDVDGIVFLVDAADQERFVDVKKELNRILSDNLMKDTPILVLGNKVDKKVKWIYMYIYTSIWI